MEDNGPYYYETWLYNNSESHNMFFIEPWNAWSSLTFLIPVFYILIRLKGQYKEYYFLVFICAPLLAIGGIGSTLFHGLRASRWLLFMDFMPIAILTLAVSIFFWVKILPKWWYFFFVIGASILIRFIAWEVFNSRQAMINTGYAITGITIFIPTLIILVKTNFANLKPLLISILTMSIALFFRYADDWRPAILSMGTHWLWHVFCAIGALNLGVYLIKLSKKQVI